MFRKLAGAAAALVIAAAGIGVGASAALAESATTPAPPSSAPAPDQGVVRSNDIQRFERTDGSNYTVWHDGATNYGAAKANGRFATTPTGLLVEGKSQIIKGETTLPDVAKLIDYAKSAKITSTGGQVWHQIGFGIENGPWTTLRVIAGQESGEWTTSQKLGEVAANGSAPLERLLSGLAGKLKYLSGGFYVDTGQTATVQNYSVNGITTSFVPVRPSVTSHPLILAPQIRPDESEYPGWHNGALQGGRYATTPNGLAIQGKVQVLYGDEKVSKEVAEFASSLQMEGDANVHYQVPVKFGDSGFTTLRATEAQRAQNLWTTSREFGAYKAGSIDKLENFALAFGPHTVIGYGFFVDEGQKAQVRSFTALDRKTTFAGPYTGFGAGVEQWASLLAPGKYAPIKQGEKLPVNSPAGIFSGSLPVQILGVLVGGILPKPGVQNPAPPIIDDKLLATAVLLGQVTAGADSVVNGVVTLPADLPEGEYAILFRGGQNYPGKPSAAVSDGTASSATTVQGATATYFWALDGINVSKSEKQPDPNKPDPNKPDPNKPDPNKPDPSKSDQKGKDPKNGPHDQKGGPLGNTGSEQSMLALIIGAAVLLSGAGFLTARRLLK